MIDNGELFLRAPARKQGARLLGAGAQRGYLVLAPAGEMPLTARQIGPIFQSQRAFIFIGDRPEQILKPAPRASAA
jgi:hypothetical protein